MTSSAIGNNSISISHNNNSTSNDNDMGRHSGTTELDNELSADEHEARAAGANKNALFGKLVGKKAARLKELVLQNLGKADRTRDELFDLYELNFYKQQQQVSKLTKEFRVYLGALKHFHEASKNLNKCIQQSTSDYQSARHDLVCENLTQMDALNEDLVDKLTDQVVKQVGEYLAKFGEMKDKISKRHRKLIDYDKSRRLYELTLAQVSKRRAKHQHQQQQANGTHQQQSTEQQQSDNYHSILRGIKFLSQQQQQQQQSAIVSSQQEFIASQLVDEARLLKFREQFNYSKLMFESINSELHDELPIVYEKKMKSLLTALQNYYALEAHYHSYAGKLLGSVSEVIDEMPTCAGSLQQRALAARKLGGDRLEGGPVINDDDDDDDQCQTIMKQIDGSSSSNNNDDDDDDGDVDDDSYESGSSCGSSAANGAGAGVADAKSKLKSKNVGSSSSGLGSSRGESSCSVGSSSPDCPAQGAVSTTPNQDQDQDQEAAVASEHAPLPSGKAAGPADCSLTIVGAVGSSSTSEQSVGDTVAEGGAAVDKTVASESAKTILVSSDALPPPPPPPSARMGDYGAKSYQREHVELADCKSQLGAADGVGEAAQVEQLPVTGGAAGGPAEPSPSVNGGVSTSVPSSDMDADSRRLAAATASSMLAAGDSALYRVKTNYQYLAEDVDELCFEANEIIQVVEFDDNHEPEEGWLMGVREINGQRGLFPANFTAPI